MSIATSPPPPREHRSRPPRLLQRRAVRVVLRIVGVLLATLLAGLALIVLALLMLDWNQARPWISAHIGEAVQRRIDIRGPLTLSWQRQRDAQAGAPSWHSWLPQPHLVARDVHIGHPLALRADGEFAHVGQFAFAVQLLPLLRGRIEVPVLRFDDPQLWLLRDGAGRNNWTFRRDDRPVRWRLLIQRVVLSRGTVHYRDLGRHIDAVATVDSLDSVSGNAGPRPRYDMAWTLRGNWNQQAISGSGKSGAVLGLHEHAAPFPLQASLDVGGTRIAAEGTLTRPTALTALDLRLQVAGPSMERLYGITGVLLPETPAFSTAGHLRGALNRHGSHWIYDDFTGHVGSSDIAGKLDYRGTAPRPLLTGSVQSRLLQFDDLGPLVGVNAGARDGAQAGKAAANPTRAGQRGSAGNRVLPAQAFRPERWTALDANVHLRAARVTRGSGLPVQNVDTVVQLRDGVLTLDPMAFDIAGGRFTSRVVLDGSGRQDAGAIRALLEADARQLQLRQLFSNVDGLRASVGELDAQVRLQARGNSVADLLGASNGDLRGAVSGGSVSKLTLEEMGLNLGSVAMARLFGDEQVRLNCLVADFGVRDGLMRSRLFVVDTAEATVHASGTVSLANEQLNLTLQPDAKSMRILSLRSPIHVRGTFKHADVSVDKGSLALRAGSALALAAVAPVAALIPLVSTGPDKAASCQALRAQAGIAPASPASAAR